MKLHLIRQIVQEQSSTVDDGVDPFEPVVLPGDGPELKDDKRALRVAEVRKQAIDRRITAIRNHHDRYPGVSLGVAGKLDGGKIGVHKSAFTLNWNHKPGTPWPQPGRFGNYGYDPADSRLDPDHLKWMDSMSEEYNELHDESVALSKRIDKLKRDIKKAKQAADAAAAAGAAPALPNAKIPTNIPTTIKVGPNSKGVSNPYLTNAVAGAGWVGNPGQYKFTSVMQRSYNAIEAALRRNKLTLSVIYVGKPGQGLPLNFIATTSDTKFVWRKYDMGGGSGQNWVFLNGNKMNTSSFVGMTAAQQDAELKKYGVI